MERLWFNIILLAIITIGIVAVVIAFFRFKSRAKKKIANVKGCVACESLDVELRGDELHCGACGYVGRKDAGGAIGFKEINALHGKPLERGVRMVGQSAALASDTTESDD